MYSVQIFSRSSAGSACISSSVPMFIHLLVCFSNCLVKEDSLHLVGSFFAFVPLCDLLQLVEDFLGFCWLCDIFQNQFSFCFFGILFFSCFVP